MIQLFAAAKCDVSEELYEADETLEKFAAAPRECACLQDDRQTGNRKSMFYFVILRNVSINSLLSLFTSAL